MTRNRANYLTGILVDTLYIVCFLVFLAGLRELVRRQSAEPEWEAALLFGSGLATAVVTLVGDTLVGAAALDTFSRTEPAVVRALTEAGLVIFGTIGPLMAACSWPLSARPSSPRARCPGGLAGWPAWLRSSM